MLCNFDACFEERDAEFLCKCFSTLSANDFVISITLVPNEDLDNAAAGVFVNFCDPLFETVEAAVASAVANENDTVSARS